MSRLQPTNPNSKPGSGSVLFHLEKSTRTQLAANSTDSTHETFPADNMCDVSTIGCILHDVTDQSTWVITCGLPCINNKSDVQTEGVPVKSRDLWSEVGLGSTRQRCLVGDRYWSAKDWLELNGVNKYIDVAVFPLHKSTQYLGIYSTRVPLLQKVPQLYSGHDQYLLHRRVFKTGAVSKLTQGVIQGVNLDYRGQGRHYSGLFAVVGTAGRFAQPGDVGAAVIDPYSGEVVGLVYDVTRVCLPQGWQDDVTLCVRLDLCLLYIQHQWRVRLSLEGETQGRLKLITSMSNTPNKDIERHLECLQRLINSQEKIEKLKDQNRKRELTELKQEILECVQIQRLNQDTLKRLLSDTMDLFERAKIHGNTKHLPAKDELTMTYPPDLPPGESLNSSTLTYNKDHIPVEDQPTPSLASDTTDQLLAVSDISDVMSSDSQCILSDLGICQADLDNDVDPISLLDLHKDTCLFSGPAHKTPIQANLDISSDYVSMSDLPDDTCLLSVLAHNTRIQTNILDMDSDPISLPNMQDDTCVLTDIEHKAEIQTKSDMDTDPVLFLDTEDMTRVPANWYADLNKLCELEVPPEKPDYLRHMDEDIGEAMSWDVRGIDGVLEPHLEDRVCLDDSFVENNREKQWSVNGDTDNAFNIRCSLLVDNQRVGQVDEKSAIINIDHVAPQQMKPKREQFSENIHSTAEEFTAVQIKERQHGKKGHAEFTKDSCNILEDGESMMDQETMEHNDILTNDAAKDGFTEDGDNFNSHVQVSDTLNSVFVVEADEVLKDNLRVRSDSVTESERFVNTDDTTTGHSLVNGNSGLQIKDDKSGMVTPSCTDAPRFGVISQETVDYVNSLDRTEIKTETFEATDGALLASGDSDAELGIDTVTGSLYSTSCDSRDGLVWWHPANSTCLNTKGTEGCPLTTTNLALNEPNHLQETCSTTEPCTDPRESLDKTTSDNSNHSSSSLTKSNKADAISDMDDVHIQLHSRRPDHNLHIYVYSRYESGEEQDQTGGRGTVEANTESGEDNSDISNQKDTLTNSGYCNRCAVLVVVFCLFGVVFGIYVNSIYI